MFLILLLTLDGKHISPLPNNALRTVCFIANATHGQQEQLWLPTQPPIPYATHAHAQYNKSKLFFHVQSYLNVHLLCCHFQIFSFL